MPPVRTGSGDLTDGYSCDCPFSGSQLGAAGPRVVLLLGLTGQDRPARQHRVAAVVTQCVLDDAVLERVVTEHDEAATFGKPLTGGLQGVLKGAEFIIHEDAQRLERASGRVVAP